MHPGFMDLTKNIEDDRRAVKKGLNGLGVPERRIHFQKDMDKQGLTILMRELREQVEQRWKEERR